MNKTKIEWTDFTWNPITGCSNDCFYCYARKISARFNKSFNPAIQLKRLNQPAKIKEPSKIFTCSMGEFFDDKVPFAWREEVYAVMKDCPQHTFQLLTKQPQNITKKDYAIMPDNLWLGVTIEERSESCRANFNEFKGLRFVSFEPLLGPICQNFEDFDWVIIGAMTGHGSDIHRPSREWIKNILLQADEYTRDGVQME